MWRHMQTGMCNYMALGLWRDLLHIAGTSPASWPVARPPPVPREKKSLMHSIICLLGQLCVISSFQAQMPTHTATSSTLSALAAQGSLLMGPFLLLQVVGNAWLSWSFTVLPLQLLLGETALIWLILLLQLDLFLEKRGAALSSPYLPLSYGTGAEGEATGQGQHGSRGNETFKRLLTLSVLTFGHPKWPTPKRSSPSESGVLLTSGSDIFLSVLRCTALIKAPHITIDAAKPEAGQAVDTAQVLCRSPWIAGQLLPIRADS